MSGSNLSNVKTAALSAGLSLKHTLSGPLKGFHQPPWGLPFDSRHLSVTFAAFTALLSSLPPPATTHLDIAKVLNLEEVFEEAQTAADQSAAEGDLPKSGLKTKTAAKMAKIWGAKIPQEVALAEEMQAKLSLGEIPAFEPLVHALRSSLVFEDRHAVTMVRNHPIFLLPFSLSSFVTSCSFI